MQKPLQYQAYVRFYKWLNSSDMAVTYYCTYYTFEMIVIYN